MAGLLQGQIHSHEHGPHSLDAGGSSRLPPTGTRLSARGNPADGGIGQTHQGISLHSGHRGRSVGQRPKPVAATRTFRRGTSPDRASRGPDAHREEHGRLVEHAYRHVCALRAHEARDRPAHRDQQLSENVQGRQGQLHPPDRLRDDPGAESGACDEQLLRRDQRQTNVDRESHDQLGDRHRPQETGWHPPAPRSQHQGMRETQFRPVLG